MTADTLTATATAVDTLEMPERLPRVLSPVSYTMVTADRLSDTMLMDWGELRDAQPACRSPFFTPRFIQLAAELLPNIEIGLARQGGCVVGVFPFQRVRSSACRPVAAGINDAHGLIQSPSTNLSTADMLRECGLKSFVFHAAPPTLVDSAEFVVGTTRSFLADLTVDPRGYEHYLRANSHTIDRQGQKTRRMIRQAGPLRFEFDCRDTAMLERLIDLKCAQYARTNTYNILGVPWIRSLLYRLHAEPKHSVRGILNVLYAGDVPVALHYGLVDRDLLHYWFPVFDPQYGYGSPGTQLFLEVARHARQEGFTAIDMGYGEQPYKYKLTNVVSRMSYGVVDESPFRRAWHRRKLRIREGLKNLPFREAIKPFARKLLPGFGQGEYTP